MSGATESPAVADRAGGAVWAVIAVVALCAALGIIRSVVGFMNGEVALALLYGVAGVAAAVGTTFLRSLKGIAVCGLLVLVVALLDWADPGTRRPPVGSATITDPDGVLWMRMPVGWTEDSNSRHDKPGYFIRRYVPASADPTAVAQLEVQVLKTANAGWEQIKPAVTVLAEEPIQRGPARGVAWRAEATGEGQSGVELHHGGRRIFVRFRAALGARESGQSFPQLRPKLEPVLDSVTVIARGWFEALDQRWFGQ